MSHLIPELAQGHARTKRILCNASIGNCGRCPIIAYSVAAKKSVVCPLGIGRASHYIRDEIVTLKHTQQSMINLEF